MRKFLFLLTVAALSAPAVAQSPDVDAEQADAIGDPFNLPTERPVITVVASGLAAGDTAEPYPVNVIEDGDLRSVQGPDLTRALRRLPGVTLTRNGGLGGFTGVRVRGAGAEQLLVLVDGVKVNDPSAPGGGFDLGNLMADEVGRIELLRGAHSVVWGSDALAGVMNLQTRAADGLAGSVEYGGARQLSAQALAGTETSDLSATISGGYVKARGISSAATGTERDGFEQWHIGGRLDWMVLDGTRLVANGRLAEGTLEIDGFPPPFFGFADTNERQDTRERSGRIGLEHDIGPLRLSAGVARSVNERDLFDEDVGPAPYYETTGRSTRAELFGRLDLTSALRLDFGADREWSRFTADSAFSADRGSARTASGHAMLTFDSGPIQVGGGARYDNHDRFGGEWSIGANGALRLSDDLTARASYGEGFKAPTLFQLLSDYGNGALRPERSRSYDAGLEYRRGETVMVGLSAFRRDSRDLIDFVSCFGVAGGICTGRPFGTYDNVGRARAEGVEVELRLMPSDRLSLGAAYSYVKARDRDAGSELARRPRHAVTVSADWETPFAITLGGDGRLLGDSFDDAGNFTRIDGRALFDLRASVPLFALSGSGDRQAELFGRVENVFDARYVEVAGFTAQGRAAYVGVRIGM